MSESPIYRIPKAMDFDMWWVKQFTSKYLGTSEGFEVLQKFVPSIVLISRVFFFFQLPNRGQNSMKAYLSMELDEMDTGRDLDRATVTLIKHIVLHGDALGLFSISVWSTGL